MAASFGLAGLAACGRPVEHLYPNSTGTDADNYLPGELFPFATVMSLGGHVTGLLAETHDGRPTKIEGKPDSSAQFGRGYRDSAGAGFGNVRSGPFG